MSQISTVVFSTCGTVICPIRGLYSRLVISERCKGRKYPKRVLSKSCRPRAGAGGQWAELGRKLRQTYLLTPIFTKVTWPYNPDPVEPLSLLRPYRALKPRCSCTPFPCNEGGTRDPTFTPLARPIYVYLGFTTPATPATPTYRYLCTRCSRTSPSPKCWWDLRPHLSNSSFPCPGAGWALRPQPGTLTTGTPVPGPSDLLPPARTVPCTYSPPHARSGL